MSKHLRTKPSPLSEAINITVYQQFLHLLVLSELPPTHPSAIHQEASKGAIIYTEYTTVQPEDYCVEVIQYFLRVMKLFYSRGIAPVSLDEALACIRVAKSTTTHSTKKGKWHFVCVPTFTVEPVADTTIRAICDLYEAHFAACDGVDQIHQTLRFVTEEYTGSMHDKWDILVPYPRFVKPLFMFPVPKTDGTLAFFTRKYRELFHTSVFRTACYFSIVKEHTTEAYGVAGLIVDEMMGIESTEKLRSLPVVARSVDVTRWRLMSEMEATRYAYMLAIYLFDDADEVDALFTALVAME